MAKADLSEAYENARYIPDGQDYPDRWADAAFDFRGVEHAIGRARLNLAYGPHERQALDLFLPAGRPEGLILFIHGGYWHKFDRTYWSHFARGGTAAGWAVAMPSYRLAPEVRIAEITQDARDALCFAAGLVHGPIRISGHSAGGHLAARMNGADVELPSDVADRLTRIVPISPLSDLRPLMQTEMNETLGIEAVEAETESPVLLHARRAVPTDIWVGAEERPAFLDQARWLDAAWEEASLRIAPGRHHFDIIDGLAEPDSPLMRSILA